MTVTVHNFGSKPIDISSCLLNGKATTILSANTIVEARQHTNIYASGGHTCARKQVPSGLGLIAK